MSFEEQMTTLYDAEAMIGVHGAGLTNMLFAPPGISVVEVFPSAYVVPHYLYMAASLGHRYAAVTRGEGELNTVRFSVDVAMVVQKAKELLGRP